MKIAVFGDVSSNLKNLKYFFDRAAEQGIEKYYCLGDIIHFKSPRSRKYSNDCINLLNEKGAILIKGNHEEWLTKIVQDYVSKESVLYLEKLPEQLIENNVLFVHKSPENKFLLFSRKKEFDFVEKEFPNQNIVFFGHSHKRLHFTKSADGEYVNNYFPKFNTVYDVSSGIHMINPGALDSAKPPFGFGEHPGFIVYNTDLENIVFKRI